MRRTSVNETILVDTGFWIAVYDRREEHHAAATDIAELIDSMHLVVPWPIVYETLRTRFVRHPEWVASLHERLRRPPITFVDDSSYCTAAYELTVEHSLRTRRYISMVDMVCRLLIDDPNVRINYLFTVNPKDYYDVCVSNRVEILPGPGG
jgi:predicted nucleic acid-binding protein